MDSKTHDAGRHGEPDRRLRKRRTLTEPGAAKAPGRNDGEQRLLPEARALAARHGVSLRTGYRMLRYSAEQIPVEGVSPYTGRTLVARKTGKDGKSYPHYRRRYRLSGFPYSLIKAAIRTARYGIRKADREAQTNGFYGHELDALHRLLGELMEIHARWEAWQKNAPAEDRKENTHDHEAT